MPSRDITAIVEDFVSQITTAVEATAIARVQAALGGAFGASPATRRGPGRPRRELASSAAPAVATAPAARKKPKVTAKLIRARKLQGQYLGALKSLNAGDKAKVKALAKSKGVLEALKLAASLKKPKK